MSSSSYLQFTPSAAREREKLPEFEKWGILRQASPIHVGQQIIYPGTAGFVVLEISDSRILLGSVDDE